MTTHSVAPSYPHPRRMRIGWDTTKLKLAIETTHESGCPTLAASLFLRLGWDSTKLNLPIETRP